METCGFRLGALFRGGAPGGGGATDPGCSDARLEPGSGMGGMLTDKGLGEWGNLAFSAAISSMLEYVASEPVSLFGEGLKIASAGVN